MPDSPNKWNNNRILNIASIEKFYIWLNQFIVLMKNKWKKPAASTLNEYQKSVIGLVSEGNLPDKLESNEAKLLKLVKGLSSKKLAFRYAKGKWNIPEVIMHLIDTERVLTYRILAISRGDNTPLPGFDQDTYIKGIDVSKIDFKKLLKEYKAVEEPQYIYSNI